jgi:hypothetical protein
VARGGLVAVYTLAAVLGLFLHSAGEGSHPRVACGGAQRDLHRDDSNGHSPHDPAHCALCHALSRISNVLPERAPVAAEDRPLVGRAEVPVHEAPASTFADVFRARAPPARPVAIV